MNVLRKQSRVFFRAVLFFSIRKCLFDKTGVFYQYIRLSLKYLQKMLKCSVLTFLLQPLCYTADLHKCKMKSKWVSPKETSCPQRLYFSPWKNYAIIILFIIQNETEFWSRAACWGWDIWFLAAPTFGAVMIQTAVSAEQTTGTGLEEHGVWHGLRYQHCTPTRKHHNSSILQYPKKVPF